jgi:RNA recognition motif-containing protein
MENGGRTLFVTNLSYETEGQTLGHEFERFGAIAFVRIVTYTGGGGNQLSRGFGFVEFTTAEGCQCALDFEGPITVDERVLSIRSARPRQAAKRDAAFIAGIVEGTTEEQIKQAFGVYHPTDVRIVRTAPAGTVSGFGFVTFATEEDQVAAVSENRNIVINGVSAVVRLARRRGSFNRFRRGGPSARLFRRHLARRPVLGARDVQPSADSTLIIENLSTHTTGEELAAAFERFGRIVNVRIVSDPGGGEEEDSTASGFIEFETAEACQSALDFEEPITAEGRTLTLRRRPRPERRAPCLRCPVRCQPPPQVPRHDRAYIAGIADGTTGDELMQIFEAYGPSEAQVLATAPPGGSGGFAWIRFETEWGLAGAVSRNHSIEIKGLAAVVFDALPGRAEVEPDESEDGQDRVGHEQQAAENGDEEAEDEGEWGDPEPVP